MEEKKFSILNIKNLSKSFGKNRIFKDANIEIKQNRLMLLRGSNGSGKSTFLKMIMGLEQPSSGKILFHSEEINQLKVFERSIRGISFMPQNYFLLEKNTVQENINLIEEILHDRVNRYCKSLSSHEKYKKIFDFTTLYPQIVETLSRGEKRKLEFWITLLASNKLILLDEPFSAWDKNSAQYGFELIQEMKDKITIIMVEHGFDRDLNKIADSIFEIDQQKIIQIK